MSTPMPHINISAVDCAESERDLIRQIVKPDGSLYASKPKQASGDAKYLWRMVAFGLSPNPKHHCLPVMAPFDLDGPYESHRDRADTLDDLAQRIERTVPPMERHGTLRWASAFGFGG